MEIEEYVNKILKKNKTYNVPIGQKVPYAYFHEVSRTLIDKKREVYTKGNIVNSIALQEVSGILYSPLNYEQIIDKLIRIRYTINDEFAILRQRDTKPEEFSEYYSYVEKCKAASKEFVVERKKLINM
ncbi:hypothetical protein [Mammaliicoccus vitulinus]|uniref:hypothetical protein n=1 Tax=Mammaliicoccus vitulinus TaxID=71237 RepID=UPI00248B9428|nr:hypothetical protein [Mammaliicoccus vitulinus]